MMFDNSIAFPGFSLRFDPPRTINPEPVFGRYFYWYGAILALGFLLGAAYCLYRAKDFKIKKDDIIDMLFFATPAAIIFARIYYVVFNFKVFEDNPVSMLYIWDGGIALYGAVIGAIIAVALICRHKKIHIGAMLDVSAMGLLIGQAVGRWGNFVNRECFGTPTSLPWGMELTVGFDAYGRAIREIVHPTFLYESLWNLAGLVILILLSKKRRYHGEMFAVYVAWYGLGRGLIEGLRTDSLMFFETGLRVSQVLAFISMVAALCLLVYKLAVKKTRYTELEAYYGAAPVTGEVSNLPDEADVLPGESALQDEMAAGESESPEEAEALSSESPDLSGDENNRDGGAE